MTRAGSSWFMAHCGSDKPKDNTLLVSMRPTVAFWLSCFAVLMMHLGPVVSGVQNLWTPAIEHELQLGHAQHEVAHHPSHAEHDQHALMGHFSNPALPQWVNDLLMCGYCELLTFTPGVVLQLIFSLPSKVPQPVFRLAFEDVYQPCLQAHAAPRAPPHLSSV